MPSYGSNDGYGQQRLSSRPSTRQSAIGAQQRDSSQMANLLAETDIQRQPAGQSPDASMPNNMMSPQPIHGSLERKAAFARRQQAEDPAETMSYQRQQPPQQRHQQPPPRDEDALRQLELARAELAEAEQKAAALQQEVLRGRGMQQQQQQPPPPQQQQSGPWVPGYQDQYHPSPHKMQVQMQQQMQMQRPASPPPSSSMPQPSRGSNFEDALEYEAVRSAARREEARSQGSHIARTPTAFLMRPCALLTERRVHCVWYRRGASPT